MARAQAQGSSFAEPTFRMSEAQAFVTLRCTLFCLHMAFGHLVLGVRFLLFLLYSAGVKKMLQELMKPKDITPVS